MNKPVKTPAVVAKCWDGAFRKINVLDRVDAGAWEATVKLQGKDVPGYYSTDPTPLFVKH